MKIATFALGFCFLLSPTITFAHPRQYGPLLVPIDEPQIIKYEIQKYHVLYRTPFRNFLFGKFRFMIPPTIPTPISPQAPQKPGPKLEAPQQPQIQKP